MSELSILPGQHPWVQVGEVGFDPRRATAVFADGGTLYIDMEGGKCLRAKALSPKGHQLLLDQIAEGRVVLLTMPPCP